MSYNKTEQSIAEGAEEMFRLLAKYASHQRLVDDPDLEKLLELDDLRRSVYEDHRIPTNFATAQLIAEETVFRHVITLHAQRIAEGAEEILPTAYEWHNYKTGHCYVDYIPHLDAKEGYVKTPLYTTIHAQRLAEKMVAENLVEFGNMIRDEPNGDIAALAEYFIRTINLKSRGK